MLVSHLLMELEQAEGSRQTVEGILCSLSLTSFALWLSQHMGTSRINCCIEARQLLLNPTDWGKGRMYHWTQQALVMCTRMCKTALEFNITLAATTAIC